MRELQKLLLKASIEFLKTQQAPVSFDQIKEQFINTMSIRDLSGNFEGDSDRQTFIFELKRVLGTAVRAGLILRTFTRPRYILSPEGLLLSEQPFDSVCELVTTRIEQKRVLLTELLHSTFSFLENCAEGLSKERLFDLILEKHSIPYWLNCRFLDFRRTTWQDELCHLFFAANSCELLERDNENWKLTPQGRDLLGLSASELYHTLMRSNSETARINRNPLEALCVLSAKEKWCSDPYCTTCGGEMFRLAFVEIANGKHPNKQDWNITNNSLHQVSRLTPNLLTLDQLQALLPLLKGVDMAKWGDSPCIRFALVLCKRSFSTEMNNIMQSGEPARFRGRG